MNPRELVMVHAAFSKVMNGGLPSNKGEPMDNSSSNYIVLDLNQVVVDAPVQGVDDEALKEWIWHNRKDEILQAMSIQRSKDSCTTQQRLTLLDQISCVQRQYLQMEPPRVVFGTLLEGLLKLMDSEYGFIGEVFLESDGVTPYLQTHAITNIAWNAATQTFYEDNIENGLKFTNLNTLFGNVILNECPLISNNPETDDRANGIPVGHPPLNHFLGIPFFEQGGTKMNGMVGIANKPGGYSEADIRFLEPFVVTCSNLIQAYGAMRENQRLVKTLEEKVLERTNELELANAQLGQVNTQLEQASAAQLQHFACMSHEIRTPLNCIIGISSLLVDTDLNPMQQESLQMMITSGELLLTVVNDVLDYSKLVSGKVDISIGMTNLQETLDAVVHSINLKAREGNVSIATLYGPNVPEFAQTDSRRLQQILYNLLGNAVKFSKPGGVVELKVQYLHSREIYDSNETKEEEVMEWKLSNCPHASIAHDGVAESSDSASQCPFSTSLANSESSLPLHESWSSVPKPTRRWVQPDKILRFAVKDYGKGIERKNFDKIFQPFLQASGGETEKVYGGTGLGLAITSKLVGQLGGTVSVDSEIEQWSEFTVDFPVDEDPAPVEKIGKALSSARIIVISVDEKERFATSVIEMYAIDVEYLESCQQLSQKDVKPNGVDICIIHEDLYIEAAYRAFRSRAPQSILFTLGPKYKFQTAKGHFRSLCQVLPSVLLQTIAAHIDSSEIVGYAAKEEDAMEKLSFDQIRVLIAEDNVINQKVLHRMLTRLGLQFIHIVDNGRSAVDATAEKDYDVVFMDMQMPIMGGIEACKLIVEQRGQSSTKPKVIFVTAHVSETFEREAEAAGGDGFISKPYSIQKIEDFFQSL